MKKQQNKPTVYISYSLKDDFQRVETVQEHLEKKGLNVVYYRRGTEYSEKLLLNADYVLFLPIKGNLKRDKESGGIFHTLSSVGKGQYSEAWLCRKHDKDAFMIHSLNTIGELFVSKLTDKYRGHAHFVKDENSWKNDYGYINSHCLGGYYSNFWDRIQVSEEDSLDRNLLLLLLD